jgi:hypothetical protein
LIAGFVSFVLVGVISGTGERLTTRFIAEVRPEEGPVYSMLVFVFKEFSDVILGSLFFHAAIVGGIGLVLIGVSWWFRRRQPSVVEAQTSSVKALESSAEPDPSLAPSISPIPEDEESSIEEEENPPDEMFG